MEKEWKRRFLLVAFGVGLMAALMKLNYVVGYLAGLLALITPILTGLLLAFILSVPMKGIARILARCSKKLAANEKRLDSLSLLLTMTSIAVILALVCTIAIPELIQSVMSIVQLVEKHGPEWIAQLKQYGLDPAQYGFDLANIQAWIDRLDLKSMLERVLTGAGSLIGSVVNVASSTVSLAVNATFSIVIMFYVLMSKRELGRQMRRLLTAAFHEKAAGRICDIAALTHRTYAKFLSGQCVEVVILGVLMFVAFTVFRIPYAGLTAALTAVFAFIPYVGAFASCVIGAMLTLLAEPSKVLLCIIVYQAVQFIENQFIYPHVVGNSVGLAPLWTLVAAVLGGKLFGLAGMVFFIPLTAVVYQLVRAWIARRLTPRLPEPMQ